MPIETSTKTSCSAHRFPGFALVFVVVANQEPKMIDAQSCLKETFTMC